MPIKGKSVWEIVKQTANEFAQDDCPRMAAALAYYTVFSLPPLLFLIIMIAGFAVPEDTAREAITAEINEVVGRETADQIGTMIDGASDRAHSGGGVLVTILGLAAFVFGATGAFAQLQGALNKAWEVAPDPDQGGLKNFAAKRLLSFGMILGTGFLLLVSLGVSALVTLLGSKIAAELPVGISSWVPRMLDLATSIAIITVLFAALYKVMPDAEIRWQDVWTGAIVTAILFVLGKFAIGFYLGRSNPGSAYGAAGSLAIVLIWIYFSSMIMLLGAEFTQVWARRYGKRIRPSKGAVRMVWNTKGEIRRDENDVATPG